MPSLSNGNFGSTCDIGQTISVGTTCTLECDADHVESVPSVTCIGPGTFDNASPICEGSFIEQQYYSIIG